MSSDESSIESHFTQERSLQSSTNGLRYPTTRWRTMVLLFLCLLVGFALRFYTFDKKSLWMDEIHTFNDSREGIQGQIEFYKKNPTYLHPPLFFLFTHLFYPFTHPERDLRIIPLVFGTLSIPMIYLLSGLFSPVIALPCAVSLTVMAYHISLSQDGRSYSLLMFLGMLSVYFFMMHLRTLKRWFLIPTAFFFSLLFYTSYSSIPFVALSQILWFYRAREDGKKPGISSFFILNGLIIFFSLPWVAFLAANYKGQALMDPLHLENPGSFWTIMYGVLHDWVPHPPLMIVSVILLVMLPLFSKPRRNAFLLLASFILPVAGLSLFCKLFNVTHFITSRYFVNFLPLFFISIYLSLSAIEERFERLRRFLRLEILFVILFIASNLVILPFYYRSEKQDLRGLVNYLKAHLREGDRIFTGSMADIPGLLHYFGVDPKSRHYEVTRYETEGSKIVFERFFTYRNRTFVIYHSKTCCTQYVADGHRLWIIVTKGAARAIKKNSPSVLKGFFDGSFLNFHRFPADASIYLFLWDPGSPEEKGIDMPIE